MRKTLLILSPIVYLLMVYACKKSGSSGSQGLGGTWIFLGITAHTQTTANAGGGVTSVATTNVVTKNNLGTITFKTDSMAASGLGYTVDTSFIVYFYYNNTVYDSAKQALTYTIPPTSATAKYSAIGTDSLYFPAGGILTALDSTATSQGCHYVLKGDSLTLTSNGIDTSGGAQTPFRSVISLKRQK
jgi:hypothetical protein